jgi:fatty acid desaturase
MLWFRRPDALIPTLSLLGYLLLAYPLALNVCYHNVHHQKPSEPWYRLPAGADGVSFLVGV